MDKDTEFRCGAITGKYVIYRGETRPLEVEIENVVEKVAYLNVEEYLKSL